MRFIPTRVHGAVDYVVGALLIASPWLFRFADESGTATWTFIVVGVLLLALSVLTNDELGLAHVIPMHMHLAADAVAGIVLALSPWIFGYANDTGPNGWAPALIIGLAELGTAAVSDPWPRRGDVRERERSRVHRVTS